MLFFWGALTLDILLTLAGGVAPWRFEKHLVTWFVLFLGVSVLTYFWYGKKEN